MRKNLKDEAIAFMRFYAEDIAKRKNGLRLTTTWDAKRKYIKKSASNVRGRREGSGSCSGLLPPNGRTHQRARYRLN